MGLLSLATVATGRLVPTLWLCAAVAAVWVASLVAVGLWARNGGQAEVQARWDATELQRRDAADTERTAGRNAGNLASVRAEAARQAIQRATLASRKELDAALNAAPVSCPVSVGDAVVPGALLMRLQAIGSAGAPGSAASQSDRPVP